MSALAFTSCFTTLVTFLPCYRMSVLHNVIILPVALLLVGQFVFPSHIGTNNMLYSLYCMGSGNIRAAS